ncbi:MAG: hypothetical protein K2L95_01450 [Alphaproteobacteria bacterium]|nr:hypothetical protein [Alphaproteobacteria bacterium]
MKYILIRIVGGCIAGMAVIVNYCHAAVTMNCGNVSSTVKTTGNVKYKEQPCTEPGRVEYGVHFQKMSGTTVAKFPYSTLCIKAGNTDIPYTGCASGNGVCNASGIICYDDYMPFLAQGCCIVSGNSLGLGYDCELDMGNDCQVSRITVAASNVTRYIAQECESGRYLVGGLAGSNISGCTGYSLSAVDKCCAACSGLQVSGGVVSTTSGLGAVTSGVLIVGSSTSSGLTACKAQIAKPIVSSDNRGTFEVAFTNGTECAYSN